jgi:hypothetical protein
VLIDVGVVPISSNRRTKDRLIDPCRSGQ